MNKLCSTLRNGFIAMITVGFLALAPSAQAVPVTLDVVGGQLRGASGVDVGGTLYNVKFLDGSCFSLFGGCDDVSDFDFQDQATASLAAQALLNTVFINVGGLGFFDSSPELTRGITDTNLGTILIPYGIFLTTAYSAVSTQNNENEAQDLFNFSISTNPTLGAPPLPGLAFAKFTTAPLSVVPLPPAGILFGSGLVFLAMLRRRTRKLEHA